MAGNATRKADGKCQDGDVEVWVWCFKKTILDKLPTPLDNVELPDFTDVSCEAAVAALKAAVKTMDNLLALPKKYASMAKALLNYPFSVAESLLNKANQAIAAVEKAINDLMNDTGMNDLKSALNSILACSYLADSEIGKLAAAILDALKNDLNPNTYLEQLKKALNSAARDCLNNLKKTPTDAINNLQKSIDEAFKRLGLDDLAKELKKLEKCVESLCKAYSSLEKFKSRLPSSCDSLLESAGGKWDSATQSIKRIGSSAASDLEKQAQAVADGALSLKDIVY